MKKILGVFLLIIIFSMCFTSAKCGSSSENSGPLKIEDFLLGGEYYQSAKAPSSPAPFRDITAARLVSEIKIGWNLGNTMDAADLNWLPSSAEVSRFETAWGNPVTTKENIETLKNAGFNAIRIPVSWTKASDAEFNIRQDWMDRVTEIVNYARDLDMHIIINTHHDESVFKFTAMQRDASLAAFWKIWSQIAYNFRNYNEKLIFEGLNEPRTKGSAKEWSGGTQAEYDIINEYHELFVKIVRASGGNNDKRAIMVTPYAASAELAAMEGLVIPKDTVENKIIVSIHAYSPYNFALNQGGGATDKWSKENARDAQDVRTPFDRAVNTFVSKGYPVIMGEFGAVNRDNESARAEWAEYYTGYGREKNIPCFWWDNGATEGNGELFGLLDRRKNVIIYPELLEALMRGAGVR